MAQKLTKKGELVIMKHYTKPMLDVVELSVKENIAGLPTAVSGSAKTETTNIGSVNNVALTTYNLATVTTSNG